MNNYSEIEYLGLPYTNGSRFMLNFRAEISNLIASELVKEGRIIFAPISAWHHIAMKYDLPTSFEYWARLDEEFIKISKKLLIIRLPGWRESSGIELELSLADKYDVPVEYIDPEIYLKKLGIKGELI